MYNIQITANAANDLTAIAQQDSKSAASIFGLIKEMRVNEKLQNILLDRKSNLQNISIQRWISAYGTGRNLYRIKEINQRGYSANNYRIIYAYIPGLGKNQSEFYILAIVNRQNFDYELNNSYTKRIIRDYDGLI